MNSIEDAKKFPLNSFLNRDGSINRNKLMKLDPEFRQLAFNYVFINKALEAHGEHYNYSRTKFVSMNQLVEIFCPDHQGYFKQIARSHLSGHGCPVCARRVIDRETEYGTFTVPANMWLYRLEDGAVVFYNKHKEFKVVAN